MVNKEERDVNEKEAFFSNKKLQKVTPSHSKTKPGDVLSFHYRDQQGNAGGHVVLVVGNERSSKGVFKGKSGRYLSAVKLNSLSDTIMGLVLDNLYKNENAAYSNTVKAGLFALVGISNYRTYIINAMSGCVEVSDAD